MRTRSRSRLSPRNRLTSSCSRSSMATRSPSALTVTPAPLGIRYSPGYAARSRSCEEDAGDVEQLGVDDLELPYRVGDRDPFDVLTPQRDHDAELTVVHRVDRRDAEA